MAHHDVNAGNTSEFIEFLADPAAFPVTHILGIGPFKPGLKHVFHGRRILRIDSFLQILINKQLGDILSDWGDIAESQN